MCVCGCIIGTCTHTHAAKDKKATQKKFVCPRYYLPSSLKHFCISWGMESSLEDCDSHFVCPMCRARLCANAKC